MAIKGNRLVVVLGMHRSGTSAITRGLQVMGVELGDKMMPPVEGNNPTGFWEDVDLNALNIEMLGAIDSDWCHTAAIAPVDVELLRKKGYFLRAAELLRQKVGGAPVFGFKDPRVAKLLPFWKGVFSHCQFDVSYLLTVRHPLSVAKSLTMRDGIEAEQGYLLWLGHVITSLTDSAGDRRILVDYDRLMQTPDRELMRVANCIGLEVDPMELQSYKNEFLDQSLRHTVYELNDLLLDDTCPPIVREVYAALLDVASDKIKFDDSELQSKVVGWSEEFGRLRAPLLLIDKLFTQKMVATKTVAERNEQIAGLNLAVVERGEQIASLNQAIAERDEQIAGLNLAVVERGEQIASLNQAIAERDEQIVGLNLAVAERDEQIVSLNLAVAERDEQIVSLNLAVAERDKQIAGLNLAIAERDGQIVSLNQAMAESNNRLLLFELETSEKNRIVQAQAGTIAELQNSSSWRVTRPLRYVGRLWRKAKDVRALAHRLLQREPLPVISRKLLRVLRHEGLRGVKARVRQQHYLATQASTEPPPVLSSLGFSSVKLASIVRDMKGHYALAPVSKGYTYIEPQCPMKLEAQLAALKSRPLFSIVVPVYNTPPELLDALLASVQAQWYPHWQLVLADDASPNEETRLALARIDHPQIKLLFLESNQGISGATNAAIKAAVGDFIVFMDHDDELTVDCLYELALCIEREEPDFIYSDEDKITEQGEYSEPHFKPDWSPDTMMSTMFTCHVSSIRRSLLEKVGGLRSQYDGCQDWDFVLRVSEQTDRISHIQKVLYHWRIIPGSTAADISAKSYILDSSMRVRKDALNRRGLVATVEPIVQVPGYFRVAYQLQGSPLISIVIPTRDNVKMLRRCVDSILQDTRYRHFELVILDNGSVEPATVAYLQQISGKDGVKVIRHDAPFNFSELNNIGARTSSGELLLFLNDDTEVLQEDWLERLGGFAKLAHVGAVGAKLLYPGQTQIQHAGVINLEIGPVHAFLMQDCDTPGYYMRNLLEYNWLAVTGACLMVSRNKFDAIGGFCETLPVAYNDIDLCLRLHDAGFYNVVCQAVRLTHHESASRGLDNVDPSKIARLERDLAYLYERNPGYFQHDPFYNPNLHPNGINFEVAF